MKNHSVSTLLFALILLLPQGITGEIYTTGAAEIAAGLHLSLDEASWLKTLNMIGQLTALPLASWLAYRLGTNRLCRLGLITGLGSTLISSLSDSAVLNLPAWFFHRVAASFLLLVAHRMVLSRFSFKVIAVLESIMLLSVVLIPMGVFPYFLSHVAEEGLWQWEFAVQIPAYVIALGWLRYGHWPEPE